MSRGSGLQRESGGWLASHRACFRDGRGSPLNGRELAWQKQGTEKASLVLGVGFKTKALVLASALPAMPCRLLAGPVPRTGVTGPQMDVHVRRGRSSPPPVAYTEPENGWSPRVCVSCLTPRGLRPLLQITPLGGRGNNPQGRQKSCFLLTCVHESAIGAEQCVGGRRGGRRGGSRSAASGRGHGQPEGVFGGGVSRQRQGSAGYHDAMRISTCSVLPPVPAFRKGTVTRPPPVPSAPACLGPTRPGQDAPGEGLPETETRSRRSRTLGLKRGAEDRERSPRPPGQGPRSDGASGASGSSHGAPAVEPASESPHGSPQLPLLLSISSPGGRGRKGGTGEAHESPPQSLS